MVSSAATMIGYLFVLLLVTNARGDDCLANVKLPAGFSIETYAGGNLKNARSMTLSKGDNGNRTLVYVATRRLSNVYALIDEEGDGIVDEVHTVIDDKNTPNGIAWWKGSLFVAQVDKVWRYDNADEQAFAGKKLKDPVLVSDEFPSDAWHGWKFIAFGPDGRLYIPVGAPCNVCEMEEYGNISYGTINRMNPDGSGLEVFATGVRNTVGFDWHPKTKELWFTDNGRDSMGNNVPDDELNKAWKAGLDFGFPRCHTKADGDPYMRPTGKGELIPDPSFGSPETCTGEGIQEAAQAMGPHVAALGMRFYTGTMFPEEYVNSIFIAQRGSWDRDPSIGYRVVRVELTRNGRFVKKMESFAEGWLDRESDEHCGRPVDVLQLPDGSLLVSDDTADDVYRISYSEADVEKGTVE